MQRITCPKCSREQIDVSGFCIVCNFKLDDEVDPNTAAKSKKSNLSEYLYAVGFLALLGLIVAFAYHGSEAPEVTIQRQIDKEKALEAQRLKEQRAEEKRAEEERLYQERARITPSTEQLSEMILKCMKDTVSGAHKRHSQFAAFVPHYSPDELRKLANLPFKMGAPSSVLDDYDYSLIDWNIKQMKEAYIKKIEIVIEGAHDGFSVRQYAAIYSCKVVGLNLGEPNQELIYYVNK